MFAVTDEDAAAIRTAFEQEGELSAAIELRRRFPLITDNAPGARTCPHHRRMEAAARESEAAPGHAAASRPGPLDRTYG
jgi:hypothetical protein